MNKIDINWLEDYMDCETCGSSSASGAVIEIDGVLAISMEAAAACFDGESFDESQVLEALFEHLGLSKEYDLLATWYEYDGERYENSPTLPACVGFLEARGFVVNQTTTSSGFYDEDTGDWDD